jgi:hypothetical protein
MGGLRGRALGVVDEICTQLLRRRVLRGTWGTASAETSGYTKRVVVVFVVRHADYRKLLAGQLATCRRRRACQSGGEERGTEEKGVEV